MFAHLVLLLGLVYKPLTQLFWSQPKPPLMAHSASHVPLLNFTLNDWLVAAVSFTPARVTVEG